MKTNSRKTNSIWMGAAIGFALLLLFAAPQRAEAQWTTASNGNDVYKTNTTGNVGVGTANPTDGKLQVNLSDSNTAWAATRDQYGLTLTNTNTTNNNWVHLVFFGSASSAAWIGTQFVNQASSFGDLTFATRGSASVGERMRVTSNGNVGIGTASPTVTLHVAATSADAITRVAQFYQPGLSTTNNYSFISIGKANATDQAAAVGFLMNTAGNDSAFITVAGDDPTAGTGLFVKKGGSVGIGTSSPTYKLHVTGDGRFTGNLTVDGNFAAKYQDLAEWVPSSEQLPTGTVVVLDSTKSNQVIASSVSYDTRVAGVISEQPGIALGERGANKVLVATTGRVRVKVDATHASIQVGDLLVASDIPGMAMKSEPVNIGGVQLHRPGTLIGKALEPLAKGQGTILVLLSLQ